MINRNYYRIKLLSFWVKVPRFIFEIVDGFSTKKMSKKELAEIAELTEELRTAVDNDLFTNATDFEIIKSLIQCAIIKSNERS